MFLERNLRREFDAAEKDYQRALRSGRQQVHRFEANLQEAFTKGQIKPSELSLRPLFEYMVPNGRELLNEWAYQAKNGGYMHVTESIGGATLKGFSYITGQMIYTTVMEQWASPDFIADSLMTTIKSNLQQDLIPAVSGIADIAQPLDDLEPYPMATITDGGVRTPVTRRRGIQVAVSKDSVVFDRTGEVLRNAANVTEGLRINKEKRCIDTVVGILNTYNWNDQAYDTYLTSGLYVNTATSNALQDYTDIENAQVLLYEMKNPFTGEPIVTRSTSILVPHKLIQTARNVTNTTEIRTTTQGGALQSLAPSPRIVQGFDIISSPYVKARTSSDTTWFFGDFKKAFAYMENYPITVEPRPIGDDSFSRGIVAGWAVFERGTPAVIEPRHVVKNTA